MPELKDRAYLARFLVKVDIPSEFMTDDKISELHEQVNWILQYDFSADIS